ncbi:MAG: hypothetical protein LBP79_01060 [Clostridiales bacterium]|jgi:hypothetical protein|nr:hypothetical protein [Clostridiales bacterium]
MTVLKKTLFIDGDCSHFRLPFTVGRGIARLEIDFSYSPKCVADEGYSRGLLFECFEKGGFGGPETDGFLPLKNLVTLSVDAPSGECAGNAHRHDERQKIVISENGGSPGFYAVKIAEGEWSAVLSAFFVEKNGVTARIEIKAYRGVFT